jgi:hypothetical protein
VEAVVMARKRRAPNYTGRWTHLLTAALQIRCYLKLDANAAVASVRYRHFA